MNITWNSNSYHVICSFQVPGTVLKKLSCIKSLNCHSINIVVIWQPALNSITLQVVNWHTGALVFFSTKLCSTLIVTPLRVNQKVVSVFACVSMYMCNVLKNNRDRFMYNILVYFFGSGISQYKTLLQLGRPTCLKVPHTLLSSCIKNPLCISSTSISLTLY